MTQSVLFFDSGVGGLSVLEQVRLQSPQLNLHYLMDDAAFPYGVKHDDELSNRVLTVCLAAVNQWQPDLLVIACNTASTLTLPLLRQQLTIPVVGVVPAIKPAAQLAGNGQIGLLATPATVTRLYISDLIQDFADHCRVERFGSTELVCWAEHYLHTGVVPDNLYDHLNPWFQQHPQMSHVVLGCTHFPLLKPLMQQLWPAIHWIDSGAAIARRVATLLTPQTDGTGQLALHWTSDRPAPAGASRFLQRLGPLSDSRPLEPPVGRQPFPHTKTYT